MRRSTAKTTTRTALLCIALITAIGLLAAPSAFANIVTPDSGGSPNANNISSLYKLTLYIAVVIFVGVEGALIYALIRFRAGKGRVAAQIRGNTRLEIGWTLGAGLILVVLAAVTFIELDSIRTPPNARAGLDQNVGVQYANASAPLVGGGLHIQVNGQQYLWRFTYPGGISPDHLDRPYSYQDMYVPTNTNILLDINSQDVVHSWWIPKLGGKFDAVPGYTNHTWFRISNPGIYSGQCAFICGRGHTRMIARVIALPPLQFAAWLKQRTIDIAAANRAAQITRQLLNAQSGPAAGPNP